MANLLRLDSFDLAQVSQQIQTKSWDLTILGVWRVRDVGWALFSPEALDRPAD